MEFLDELNKQFNNKYDYLRVLRVDYNTLLSFVEIDFLYPENVQDLTDEDKTNITKFLTNLLKLNAELKLKFRKSYLDDNLIKKDLQNYLKTTYSSMMVYFSTEDMLIARVNDTICVNIKLLKNIYDYFISNNVKESILEHLNSDFIGNFTINFEQKKGQEINTDGLIERDEKFINELPKQKPIKRYEVFEPQMFIGHEITPMPEPIKNQKDTRESVILAGKISNLVTKTYISRRAKAIGSTEPSYYFSFTLTDHTGDINMVYFSNKTTYKKAVNLKDGDSILVIGNVKHEYNKTSVVVKDISFCTIIPPKEKPKLKVKEDETPVIEEKHDYIKTIKDYKCVFPTPYIAETQENLFDVKPTYDDEIYKHEYVVFDCETTGLDCRLNEIIEIGAVKIKDGLIKDQFQTFIHPTESIPEEITRLTSITNEMVENAPCSNDAILDFYKFCEGCILVGYNVAFDIGFVKMAGQKANVLFDHDSIDVMVMAKKQLFLSKYRLSNVVDALNITLNNAHRAIFDATATAYAFLKLSEKKKS